MMKEAILTGKKEGYIHLMKEAILWGKTWGYLELLKKPFLFFFSPIIVNFHPKHQFKINEKKYNLFYHRYNFTWTKERGIEVPFAINEIKNCKGNVLEVGNVLSHYFTPKWDIVDKYEKDKKVINEDIVDFNPKKKYDLIISISTFEHIGWDEEDKSKSADKIEAAFNNLKQNCLKENGKIIISVPIGWNPHMDSLIKSNKLNFKKMIFMKRVGSRKWISVPKEIGIKCKYKKPYPYANCVFFGEYEKTTKINK